MNRSYIEKNYNSDCLLIDGTKPSFQYEEIDDLPTTAHCIGRNRLLGQFYALAITEVLPLKNSSKFMVYHELCILLRAFVVIDDYQRDTLKHISYINGWLNNIKNKIKERLNILDVTEFYFNNILKRIEDAYANEKSLPDKVLVERKCELLKLPLIINLLNRYG